MWRILFSVLLLSTCANVVGVATVSGQSPVRANAAGGATKAEKKGAESGGGLSLRERRSMALDALDTLVKDRADALPSLAAEKLPVTSGLIARAALLIWKYDRQKSARYFRDLAGALLDRYKKGRREKADAEGLAHTRQAIKRVLSLWATKDAAAAADLLRSLQDAEAETSQNSDPKARAAEQFELAGELLATDPQQSALLAERVVETSVPLGFPAYLHKLRKISPAAASRIFSKTLTILAAGGVYSYRQQLVLQAYAFREPMIVYPLNEPVDFPGFESLPFPAAGVYTIDYTFDAGDAPDAAETSAFASASLAELSRKLSGAGKLDGLSAATAYFILNKDAAFLSGNAPASLPTLLQIGAAVATNSGVPEQNLTHLANVAREVAAKNFLRLLRNNASEAAEKSDDPALKGRVLEQAIFGDIKAGRYDAAEAKIFRVEDRDTREALSDYFWTARAVGAAKQREWASADSYLERVNNRNVRSYALLECALAASNARQQSQSTHYLQAARLTIEGRLSDDEQPQMLAGLLAVLAETNSAEMEGFLFSVARGINRPFERVDVDEEDRPTKGLLVPRYAGGDVWIYSKGLTDGAISYRLADSGLESAFAGAAARAWLPAYTAAQAIKEPSLKGQALLGVCRATL
jgi:hypothetical protein